MRMRAVWLPGGVTHLRRLDEEGHALCGRNFEGTFADSEEHDFPQPEGGRRSERYCKRCEELAREDGA